MYRRSLHALSLVLTLALLFGAAPQVWAKGSTSKRTYRKLTLPNGLKVILVSDAGVNVSAASMSVGVGAIADPKGLAGMAHFLEHMLFLGTKKYPKLNAYGEFLRSRGGYSNAYTAADHTNYHFQVNHSGLPEALDRFGNFFISPTLDFRHAQREMMAVHSEHMKNVPQDNWRLIQLQRSMLKKSHPANGFYTGNMQTLDNADDKALKKFFKSYYSADNMALCIISPLSLDRQEKMVRTIFSPIKKYKFKPFTCSGDILDQKKALRLIKVVPVKDIRQLKLFFPVPSQHDKVLTKTARLFGMTMGDEGKGSLLSFLKKRGLATSLSAGLSTDTKFYSTFRVTVGLTKKGLAKYKSVLSWCFSYINMLKKSKFPQHVWNEAKTMSRLSQLYSPKGEGTQAAISIANNTRNYGLKVGEKVNYIFKKSDPKNYRNILKSLVPENMLTFVVGKGLKTDKVEKWYQTKYSYQEISDKYYKSLALTFPHSEMHLPLPNPFVPKQISVLKERPVRIVRNSRITLWHAQDVEFKRPKVALYFPHPLPVSYTSARSAALSNFYTTMIRERLNEYSYPALMAGLGYSLTSTKKGLLLSVNGWSDSAMKLLEVVGKELTKTSFDAKRFAIIKERMVRGLKNSPFSPAYAIAREHSRKIHSQRYYLPSEILAEVKTITLDEVKNFVGAFFLETHIQGMAVGNISAGQAAKAAYKLYSSLGSLPISPRQAFKDKIVWLKSGDDLTFKKRLQANNSCLWMEYQIGKADLKTRAASWIMDRGIRNGFYTEMRTRQMLGYIVFSGAPARQNVMKLVFIIQSGTKPAHDLFKRADKYLGALPKSFSRIPDRYFEAIRQGLIRDRQKKIKTIAAKAGMFYGQAYQQKGDFNRLEKEIAALRAVKKADVIKLLQNTLGTKTRRRVSILLDAKQHPVDKTPATLKDVKRFHKARTFIK